MKTKMILACAGLAVCGAAQGQVAKGELQSAAHGKTVQPVSYRIIDAIRVDGTHVYRGGEIAYRGGNAANVGRAQAMIYNAAGLGADTDGDGFLEIVCGDACAPTLTAPSSRWFFGGTFNIQHYVEDVEFAASDVGAGKQFDGAVFLGINSTCAPGVASEVYSVVLRHWDTIDQVADGFSNDGLALGDGFDSDGDGVSEAPYDYSDNDGDGFIDSFVGGFVVTFADTDTDGDGINDAFLGQDPALGYGQFDARGLGDTDGDGTVDVTTFGFTANDNDADGRPDGAFEVIHTRGAIDTDGDGAPDGPILGGFFPSTRVTNMLWSDPNAAQIAACTTAAGGASAGTGTGLFYAQGQDPLCVPATGFWSTGVDGTTDAFFDASADVTDFTGAVACPSYLTGAVTIVSEDVPGPTRLCADQNQDGLVLPNDFSAWIANFNANNLLADVNQNGLVQPNDFSAWIGAFNQGANGPTCNP
jgi:hypothetical protein